MTKEKVVLLVESYWFWKVVCTCVCSLLDVAVYSRPPIHDCRLLPSCVQLLGAPCAAHLKSVGEIPSANMTQPIKVTNCCMNSLLLGWSCKPELFRQRRTDFRFWMCRSSSCPMIRMSCRMTATCSRPWRMMSMVHWNCWGWCNTKR